MSKFYLSHSDNGKIITLSGTLSEVQAKAEVYFRFGYMIIAGSGKIFGKKGRQKSILSLYLPDDAEERIRKRGEKE